MNFVWLQLVVALVLGLSIPQRQGLLQDLQTRIGNLNEEIAKINPSSPRHKILVERRKELRGQIQNLRFAQKEARTAILTKKAPASPTPVQKDQVAKQAAPVETVEAQRLAKAKAQRVAKAKAERRAKAKAERRTKVKAGKAKESKTKSPTLTTSIATPTANINDKSDDDNTSNFIGDSGDENVIKEQNPTPGAKSDSETTSSSFLDSLPESNPVTGPESPKDPVKEPVKEPAPAPIVIKVEIKPTEFDYKDMEKAKVQNIQVQAPTARIENQLSKTPISIQQLPQSVQDSMQEKQGSTVENAEAFPNLETLANGQVSQVPNISTVNQEPAIGTGSNDSQKNKSGTSPIAISVAGLVVITVGSVIALTIYKKVNKRSSIATKYERDYRSAMILDLHSDRQVRGQSLALDRMDDMIQELTFPYAQ